MKVSDLLKEIEYSHIINEQDLEFSNISYNSKTAKEGDLFKLRALYKDSMLYPGYPKTVSTSFSLRILLVFRMTPPPTIALVILISFSYK